MVGKSVSLALTAFCAVALATGNPAYKVIFHLENLENGNSGEVVVNVHPEWAPLGAQRFAELVEQRFFDNTRFFRVVTGFVAQFGISGDPEVTSAWRGKTIGDDSPQHHVTNNRGRLSFYTDGKDDRSTQIVFNVKDNDFLDNKGYVPFAEVADGMFYVDRIFNGYGGSSRAPVESRMQTEGNAYLERDFPRPTYIKTVEVVKQQEPQALAMPGTAYGATSPLLIALGLFVVTGIVGGWHAFLNSGSIPDKV